METDDSKLKEHRKAAKLGVLYSLHKIREMSTGLDYGLMEAFIIVANALEEQMKKEEII